MSKPKVHCLVYADVKDSDFRVELRVEESTSRAFIVKYQHRDPFDPLKGRPMATPEKINDAVSSVAEFAAKHNFPFATTEEP